MESLGKVQIRAVVNGQYWVAKPNQDYSAVVLTTSSSDSLSWFDIMKLSSGNQIAFKSAYSSGGQAVYVSARPDWYGKLQLQAPYSADWITAVGGDETYALINIGNNQVAFKLLDPASYVSARLDQPDPRTDNNGISVSVRQGFTLFQSYPGTYVESVGDWERFELAGVDTATLSHIMTVAVAD